jgi:hypothetical protein
MYIPKHWARIQSGQLASLGWSDRDAADAERLARERLAKLQALARGDTKLTDWDYYPALPVKEEILETPAIPGITVLITRNRAGVKVLNTDKVAFIDIDLPAPKMSLGGWFKSLLGKKPAETPASETAALDRARGWAADGGALLRAYRTARGLRLIRMDKLMDPAADETDRMFTALGTDLQYQRLCKVQKSFRARLTPKPGRVGCDASPGSHPRIDPQMQQAFAGWLRSYELQCRDQPVCAYLGDCGSGLADDTARRVSALHDRLTLGGNGRLA